MVNDKENSESQRDDVLILKCPRCDMYMAKFRNGDNVKKCQFCGDDFMVKGNTTPPIPGISIKEQIDALNFSKKYGGLM